MLNLVSNGPSGYNLNNSLRFRSSASARLSRTFASTGTNNKIQTLSVWVKRGLLSSSTVYRLMGCYDGSSANSTEINFTNDSLKVEFGGAANNALTATQVFRDPSAWYHVVIAIDTTQATAANRVKMYVNGNQVTVFSTANYPSQNAVSQLTSANANNSIGSGWSGFEYFDGYMTEINFVDGQQLTPSSFGSTSATTGSWQPAKYTGTYGTNGFYLKFADASAATAAAIGKDSSGNGNNWTPSGISVTAGTTYDAMLDVPTNTSATVGNYCVLNPLWKASTGTLSNGNLNYTESDSLQKYVRGTIGVTSGKWYFEGVFTNTTSAMFIGMSADTETSTSGNAYIGNSANGWSMQVTTTVNKVNNATFTSISATNYISTSNVFMVAYDADNGKLFFGVNGTWFNSADPAAGTNAQFTSVSGTLYPSIGTQGGGAVAINCGQRPFTYTPPTGFVALNTFNLPTPTILQGNKYMDATTYTGNSSTQVVVNQGQFKPDFVWVKGRSGATDHALYDSVRGTTKDLVSNSTATETTQATGLTAFGTGGFTVGALAKMNTSAATYVAWQWQAGQGSSSSNTSGSITSTVSVNATAGFSVVTYTGNSTTNTNYTIGHGLGVAPKMVIIKSRTWAAGSSAWLVWHASSSTAIPYLDSSDAASSGDYGYFMGSTAPTSTVFTVRCDTTPSTGARYRTFGPYNYVAYCWAEIAGFSKFGSYTGNANSDGPFVYCGFRPKYVLLKNASAAFGWTVWDTSRNTYNVVNNYLVPNGADAEAFNNSLDILSNGFKIRDPNDFDNGSGNTIIFAAFAENPFKNANAR